MPARPTPIDPAVLCQPAPFQQLGVLRSEGVVSTRRDGKYVYYRVADPQVMTLLERVHRRSCRKETT